MSDRATLLGIDFSGGRNAGAKIWVATASERDGRLTILDCRRGECLPDSGSERERCLAALRRLIRESGESAIGIDVPFGLPRALVPDATWVQFVLAYPDRYADAEAFRAACRAAGATELRRDTDREARTPFGPYNLRLYRQTDAALRGLLAPLLREDAARALPMQARLAGRPALYEVCPASLLKRLGLYRPYKGVRDAHTAARLALLGALERLEPLEPLRPELRACIAADREGDALDSVIAAVATQRAMREPGVALPPDDARLIEGHVYC